MGAMWSLTTFLYGYHAGLSYGNHPETIQLPYGQTSRWASPYGNHVGCPHGNHVESPSKTVWVRCGKPISIPCGQGGLTRDITMWYPHWCVMWAAAGEAGVLCGRLLVIYGAGRDVQVPSADSQFITGQSFPQSIEVRSICVNHRNGS